MSGPTSTEPSTSGRRGRDRPAPNPYSAKETQSRDKEEKCRTFLSWYNADDGSAKHALM